MCLFMTAYQYLVYNGSRDKQLIYWTDSDSWSPVTTLANDQGNTGPVS